MPVGAVHDRSIPEFLSCSRCVSDTILGALVLPTGTAFSILLYCIHSERKSINAMSEVGFVSNFLYTRDVQS